MSDLVGNPEDRFSRVAAQIITVIVHTVPRHASTVLYQMLILKGQQYVISYSDNEDFLIFCINAYQFIKV